MSPDFASDITYTKNYLSFICNSNSMGTPAFCMAVPSLNSTVSANGVEGVVVFSFVQMEVRTRMGGWMEGWSIDAPVGEKACCQGTPGFPDDHPRRAGSHKGEVQAPQGKEPARQGGTHCPLLLPPSCSAESHPVRGLPHWNQL